MTRRSGRSGARLACVWRRRHARWLAGLACGCSGRPPRLRARDSAPERPGGRAPACASSTTAESVRSSKTTPESSADGSSTTAVT